MTDRGEAIVNLANALLSGENDQPHTHRSISGRLSRRNKSADFKKRRLPFAHFYFIAVLSCCTGGFLAHYIDGLERPIDRHEQIEFNALLTYTARLQGADAAQLTRDLTRALGLRSLHNMSTTDCRRARRFLWDLLERS